MPVAGRPGEPTTTTAAAARVAAVRALAAARGVPVNSLLDPAALDRAAPLTPPAAALLDRHLRAGRLSARGLHRVRRVARSLADLALDVGTGPIAEEHVAEALALRVARAALGVDGRS